MARPVGRIPEVLSALGEYWMKNPDLRLGQIVVNVGGRDDPFYLEDDELLEKLEDELTYREGSDRL